MGFRSVMAPVESFPKIIKSAATASLSRASHDASVTNLRFACGLVLSPTTTQSLFEVSIPANYNAHNRIARVS
ncbi:MAG TPA: hypothetical protein PKK99_05665 [Bacteroidia bacterium]|nr:hypothetical protein [Bacteroidia bacterium]